MPFDTLEALADSLGVALLECVISRHRGSVQARLIVSAPGGTGINDCSKYHRLAQTRLELAFPDQDVYLEVSSPGLDRLLKDAREFAMLLGRGVRCYRTDIADWTAGIIEAADQTAVTLRTDEGVITLSYIVIAKAMLDSSREV